MVDMQLLLRGAWRFHCDEGREFMAAFDYRLMEHAVFHTTAGACGPNAKSLFEGVLVLENLEFDVSRIKQTHLYVCGLKQQNTQTK